ncbi:hypothetical protein T190115A13A_40039 [Tenacibaculum sp. 190524A02b]|uniref:Uncharacterized protein n=1 Tax=Tenacibaculum vairaonense TaxID=3137860 RepID=A0ABP1FB09_9FLAO
MLAIIPIEPVTISSSKKSPPIAYFTIPGRIEMKPRIRP